MRLRMALLYLLFNIVFHSVQSQNWSHHTVLDDDSRFHLHWNPPEEITGDSEIAFKVEIAAKGYFELGFSPDGGIPGSDIVTGWIKDGEIYFQDRHAGADSLPVKDDQQDYELTDAYENDTFTVFIFRRKLDTCDENDMAINGSTMRIIYAYSEEVPESGDPFYHMANRGVKSVLLLQKIIKNADLNYSSLLHWDVRSPGVDFSNFDTLYWCTIFKTPQVSEKNHIISVKPVFEDDHEYFIHHMALYECVGGTPEEFEKLLDQAGHECLVPDMPPEMLKCYGYAINWAVGGEDTTFPEHVGWPINPDTRTYYMLEMHYNNPEFVSGIIDHSGLSLYYTPNLRDFDVGNIMMGSPILPRMFIPPGQEEYVVAAHTSPRCIPWNENGIKAIGLSPHAHITNRKIKLRHFRGNQELIPLLDENNYDFYNQAYRFYMKEVDILPGDQITIECTYDTSQRSNVTFGGESTREEMCMGFLLHYPLVSRTPSFSVPSFATISQVFGTNITTESDVLRVLGSYNWQNADIGEVQNAMRYSEHETSCNLGEFPEEAGNHLVTYPQNLIPYEPPPTCNVIT